MISSFLVLTFSLPLGWLSSSLLVTDFFLPPFFFFPGLAFASILLTEHRNGKKGEGWFHLWDFGGNVLFPSMHLQLSIWIGDVFPHYKYACCIKVEKTLHLYFFPCNTVHKLFRHKTDLKCHNDSYLSFSLPLLTLLCLPDGAANWPWNFHEFATGQFPVHLYLLC